MSSLYSGIIPIIKKAALDAVNSTQPVNVLFGTVTSSSPLKIQVTPKLILGSGNLMLTSTASKISFKKNDTVILLRVQGGNSYLVLDKAVNI